MVRLEDIHKLKKYKYTKIINRYLYYPNTYCIVGLYGVSVENNTKTNTVFYTSLNYLFV